MKRLILTSCLLFFIVYQGDSQYLTPLFVSGNTKGTIADNNYTATVVFGQNIIGISANADESSYYGLLAPAAIITGTDDFPIDGGFSFTLYQNLPNPFNKVTSISFDLEKRCYVTLEVFNVFGQLMEQFYDRELDAGTHSVEFTAVGIPEGIYFYRMKVNGCAASKSMIFVK